MTQPTASSSSQHLVPVTVQAGVSTPLKQAFDSAVGVDLSKIFKRLGPIPAVVSTHGKPGLGTR